MGGKNDMNDPRFVISHGGDPEFSLITRSSDGQMMFLVNMLSKMQTKTPLGSRTDRHENIGDGYIGADAFRRILAHPKLSRLPFILETPFDNEGDDRRNLETLKKLCPKSPTITTKLS